jgi:hypothetical protein
MRLLVILETIKLEFNIQDLNTIFPYFPVIYLFFYGNHLVVGFSCYNLNFYGIASPHIVIPRFNKKA